MTIEQKPNKRRSYFGPILLITVGLIFLAENLGFIPGDGWETIIKLWPVLLIIAGVDDLIRREGIAWPILLIGAGTFLLFNNFGPQAWISWTQLFQLWPILLIAFGIDLMFKGKSGWMTAAGIILTIALIGSAFWIVSEGYKITAEYGDVIERYGLDIQETEINLSLGLGEMILSNQSKKGVLIAGKMSPDKNQVSLYEKGGRIFYSMENNVPTLYPHSARWELGISEELNLDLVTQNGAGDMFLALEQLNLDSLDASQGVGRVVIRLPQDESQEIFIHQAIGMVHVQIPEDMKVTVDAQNGLSRVDFPPDFKLKNGLYSSPGATKTNSEISITVEQAIGYITFEYKK
ncbi:MAG: DUF5668 domain-containing protein [Anaerolineales bacterium]